MTAPAPDPELIAIFETEVVESVDVMRGHLQAIERGAADGGEHLADVLRLAHDLKGSARVVGYSPVARLAHALESHLLPWRRLPPGPGEIDLAQRCADLILDLAQDIRDDVLQTRADGVVAEMQGARAPAAPTAPASVAVSASPAREQRAAPAAPAAPSAVGRPTAGTRLHVTLDLVNRVRDDSVLLRLLSKNAQERVAELRRATSAARAIRAPRGGASPRETTRVLQAQRAALAGVSEACNAAVDLLISFEGHAVRLDDEAFQLCLVPARDFLESLQAVALDTARKLGREIRVEVEGSDLRVDKELLEALKEPLKHAVRNAVDHGIESTAERIAAGKPPAGWILLRASDAGARLLVTVADDGRGIDRDAVRRRLGERVAGLDDQRLLQALLRSGVSTRDEVTEISGRGIGLGALAVAADRRHGDVEVTSRHGHGTRLTLSIPPRLSTVEGCHVESAGHHFVIPLSAMGEVDGAGTPAGEPDQVPSLASLLGLPGTGRPAQRIRLRSRDRVAVLGVDRVHTAMEVVMRSTGAHLGTVPFVLGATILPRGEPAFILNPREVVEACPEARPAAGPTGVEATSAAPVRAARDLANGAVERAGGGGRRPAPQRRRILLADDSATLRTKLHHDLALSGYDVVLANDGQGALDRLDAMHCDAIVSDIQMPRLDGLQLLERCAGRVPVVLMTAFPDAAGEARALALGAVAYLVKDDRLGERVLSLLRQTLNPSPDRCTEPLP